MESKEAKLTERYLRSAIGLSFIVYLYKRVTPLLLNLFLIILSKFIHCDMVKSYIFFRIDIYVIT